MNKKWEYGKLKDAVDRGSSNISLNKIKGEDGKYPVFAARGFVQNVSFYHQENEYLGIIKDGAGIGRVSKYPAKSSIVATMQYLIPKEGFDIDFIRYFLEGIDFEKHRSGSTIPHIYFKDYKSEKFPKLSLPEQQRIVSILDHCFEAIDKAKANAEQNLQNAKELFESYLQGVFESDKDGWEEKKLKDISKINYGYTEKASFEEVGPKFLRITDIQDNNVNWDTVPYCKCSDKDLPKYKLETGDIVFARTGATTGKSYLIKNPPKSVFASYLIRLKMKSKKDFIPEFISYFFQTKRYWDEIKEGTSGSAQGGFNATKLGELQFPFPKSMKEQQTIVSKLDAFQEETKKLEVHYQKRIDDLEELKKSILQKAFAGELKTDKMVEELEEIQL